MTRSFQRLGAATPAQLSGMLASLRSRSAAKAKQARSTSRESCEKSARISSSLVPLASQENVAHRDPSAADGRLAESDLGVGDDALAVVHVARLFLAKMQGKPSERAAGTVGYEPSGNGHESRSLAMAARQRLEAKSFRYE